MRTPIIAINMKTYEQSCGEAGINLASLCQEIAEESGHNIAIATQQTDLALFACDLDIPVFAPITEGYRMLPHIIQETIDVDA